MDIKSFQKINSIHYIDEEVHVKQLLKFVEPKYNNIKTRIYQRAEEIVNYLEKSNWRSYKVIEVGDLYLDVIGIN